MAWLSVVGLVLDLIGVVLLGIDLHKVQIAQKAAAKRNKVTLNEAFPNFRDISTTRTYLESGDYGGGEFEGNGGVDVSALSSTLSAYQREIENSANGVVNVIEFLFSSAQEKADEAQRSISHTRFGLGMIVLGFLLQLTGAIGTNPQLLEWF